MKNKISFEYSGYPPIENPDKSDIIKGIKDLGNTMDEFAILAKTDLTYIQTSGNRNDGYTVEYQDGSIDKHFIATDNNITENIIF